MNLPPALLPALRQVLAAAGDAGDIRQATPVSGGCINNAVRLETQNDTYLLKWNFQSLPAMFPLEAEGLRLLAETHTVRVPRVIAARDGNQAGLPAFIVEEFIQAPDRSTAEWDAAQFGARLAQLHRQSAETGRQQFGLAQDNYLGTTLQPNGWYDDWILFFRDQRLHHQIRLAQSNGRLPAARRRLAERLLDQLPRLLGGVPHPPALLHGDLWAGNVIPDENGQAALIDPAVYYGDREAELAYTELFGGFSRRFYQAYQDTWPLESGYPERRDLYNVYHLLNHLNLFGEAYGGQLDAILRYYLG